MRTRSLVLLTLLAVPALAGAQYDPGAPPPSRPLPPPRAAPGPRDTGVTLGARVGYGWPEGRISDEGDPRLDDLIDHKIPIWLEIGYRFSPTVRGDFYLELAPMTVNDGFCLAGRSCDGGTVRFGVDVQFHLAPHQLVDPWLGLGLGAEFISADAFDPSVGDISTFGYGGIEFPLVEAGLDFSLAPRFTLGPYLTYSHGWFTSYSVETPGFADASGRIHDRASHAWVQLGLKGTFKL